MIILTIALESAAKGSWWSQQRVTATQLYAGSRRWWKDRIESYQTQQSDVNRRQRKAEDPKTNGINDGKTIFQREINETFDQKWLPQNDSFSYEKLCTTEETHRPQNACVLPPNHSAVNIDHRIIQWSALCLGVNWWNTVLCHCPSFSSFKFSH